MHSHDPALSKTAADMKVLFILPSVAVGGVERVRLTLMQQFAADGIECQLALRKCKGELIERARSLGPVHELAPRRMHQFIPELIKLIKCEKPTHIVTAFPDIAVLTWIAMRLAGQPVSWVHSVHNTHSMKGSRAGTLGRLRYRLENRMAGFAYRHANAVIAVSEGVRQEILDRYQTDPERVTTIYNPVVPDKYLYWERSSRLGENESYRITTIGRLVHQKGFDILIRAMARTPGLWQLDIWGEGPERENLEAIINEEGLKGRVKLRGYTSDPYGILREADLFVTPSRHEGLVATLIEAIACQCQVIATDCPQGPREILNDGRIGQLVPVDDIDALMKAITRTVRGEHHVPHELLRERARDFLRSALCLRWKSVLINHTV